MVALQPLAVQLTTSLQAGLGFVPYSHSRPTTWHESPGFGGLPGHAAPFPPELLPELPPLPEPLVLPEEVLVPPELLVLPEEELVPPEPLVLPEEVLLAPELPVLPLPVPELLVPPELLVLPELPVIPELLVEPLPELPDPNPLLASPPASPSPRPPLNAAPPHAHIVPSAATAQSFERMTHPPPRNLSNTGTSSDSPRNRRLGPTKRVPSRAPASRGAGREMC